MTKMEERLLAWLEIGFNLNGVVEPVGHRMREAAGERAA